MFADILRRKSSPADLRKLLAELDAEEQAARAELNKLTASRESVFLNGTDAEIATLQDGITRAQRNIEVITVRAEALRKRLEEAEREEKIRDVKVAHRVAEKAAEEIGRILSVDVAAVRDTLDKITDALDVLVKRIEESNRTVLDATGAGLVSGLPQVTIPNERVAAVFGIYRDLGALFEGRPIDVPIEIQSEVMKQWSSPFGDLTGR